MLWPEEIFQSSEFDVRVQSRADKSAGCERQTGKLTLEPRGDLPDHAAGQEQQRTTVEQAEDQLAVFGVVAEILRYPDQQHGPYHWSPERSDASDNEDRH